ncbi:MAG: imidazole glycerol phosphate synthase subunit HisH [Endomicrobium sp.]|jgi:glutamine amidotransferase|nr:imidazole glycerol phosphate synthase subunit HisH [Endomicrobium sp.]
MKIKIAVIDYGMGNIKSVVNALHCCKVETEVIKSPLEIKNFDAIILPGVGAFSPAIKFLKLKRFDVAIRDYANCSDKMIYGICLGFQLFFTKSYENGEHYGLNLISGEVKKIETYKNLKIPHIGWNNINILDTQNSKKMFDTINTNELFYFVHSYYVQPKNLQQISSICNYGTNFCSSIVYKNIWGTQFHPEKSGAKGLKILVNFVKEVKLNACNSGN